jgi:hypothetical protein
MVWRLQPIYETLTSPTALPVTAATSSESVRVVFRRDVALAEVNALLREIPAQIIAGPTEAGVFTLALPVADASNVDLTKNGQTNSAVSVLARLRTDARVIFAEPAEIR